MGLQIGYAAELLGNDGDVTRRTVGGEPVGEVVQAAGVPGDGPGAVADVAEVAFVARARGERVVEGRNAVLAHELRQGEHGLHERDAIELVQVDDEVLGAGRFERGGAIRGADEALAHLRDGIAGRDGLEPLRHCPPHLILKELPVAPRFQVTVSGRLTAVVSWAPAAPAPSIRQRASERERTWVDNGTPGKLMTGRDDGR